MMTRHQALEILGYRCTTWGNPPEIVEWVDERPQPAGWEDIIAEAEVVASSKRWEGPSDFLSEFTLTERGAIWNTDDPVIGGLVLLLTAWRTEVLASDANIQYGVGRLVSLGILSLERATQILGKAPEIQPI